MAYYSPCFTRVFSEASLADWLSTQTTADRFATPIWHWMLRDIFESLPKQFGPSYRRKIIATRGRIPRIEINAATGTVRERRFRAYCGASVRMFWRCSIAFSAWPD
jgi:hypothetical protein